MVVAGIGENVKTVLATEIPGDRCTGVFVCDGTASNWSNGNDVVVKGAIELLSI